MITHIVIGTNNLEATARFYDAVLGALGAQGSPYGKRRAYSNGTGPAFVIGPPLDGEAATHANGGTIGFVAADTSQVDAFHAAGLKSGGRDEGAPGKRPDAPGNAYGAYLRDPDGHKICAFCQLPEGE